MEQKTELMGPPERGPWVRVSGNGLDVTLRVDGEGDREILRAVLDTCERRRYGKAGAFKKAADASRH